jgi:hypothetical protein
VIKNPYGVIYFMQIDMPESPVKIGFTKTSVRRRIMTLQQMAPFRIKWLGYFDGHYTEERKAHRKFHDIRVRGEWFQPTPEVFAFIDEKCPGFTPLFADEITYTRRAKNPTSIHLEIPGVVGNT